MTVGDTHTDTDTETSCYWQSKRGNIQVANLVLSDAVS